MFKGRVDRVSHEGGLLVSYSGACPALGSVMVDSSETYIGKVDGVIGNLNDSLVHIAHLDRSSNATELVGVEITIRSRKAKENRQSNDDRKSRDDRHGRDDRRGGDDRRDGYDKRGNSNHQKQDWDCPKCSNSNFSFRTECNRCGEEKGGGGSPQRNDRRGGDDRRGGNDRHGGRDDRRGGDDRRGNSQHNQDWDCPKCSNSNFAFRTECNRCGEEKGGGGSPQRNDRRGGDDRRGGRDDRRGGDDRRGNSQHNQDWDCPKCSNSNFAFRTECNRCGEEKGGRGSSPQRNDRRGGDDRRSGGDNRRGGDNRQENRGTHSDNDWECKECNNSNFSFRKDCNRCGEPKGRAREQSSTRWEGNDRRAGERKEAPQPRAGDWDCPQCGKSNFAKRNDCFSCGRSKRVGGPKDKGHHRKLRDPPPLQSAKYGRDERRSRE